MTRLVKVMLVAAMIGLGTAGARAETGEPAHAMPADAPQPIFTDLKDAKWSKIIPDLGAASPEMAILHIDPKTQATKLLIRTPKALHVRKHWHSANETHTMIKGESTFACDGKRVVQRPGDFNWLPAKMVHEAWVPAGGLVFITVDGPWDVNWVEGPPTAADLVPAPRPARRR